MTQITRTDILNIVTQRAKDRIKGSVRLEMPDLFTLYVDETGAVESDREADITLTANSNVFYEIATGVQNPASAFMTRKLKVDGNPMRALKIGEILSTEA
ncbi:SCP2 sterol-binding domain-containing protein [Marivita sp. S6314]|uniref:SCP2 sterol-binding domain-containing protein n=1 Tax=Marivita sp. S6314 TaxID=2926406 RepID=UPI001FF1315B|nr:SCP2 sterol-binding domain-containing protein [Marivita sp. S6314]MCK0149120.1 SCP2 sterol-binding domain-containing protein [Marivita sp. S6314]